MNYIELQNALKEIGFNISIVTLRRYVKEGLIPEPERIHLGRGKGQHVSFPCDAIEQAGAAYLFLKQPPTYEMARVVKNSYLLGKTNPLTLKYYDCLEETRKRLRGGQRQ